MIGGNVSRYATIHAWTRARYATMLTPGVWAELRETPDFPTLIIILRETVYGPYLTGVEESTLTPRRAAYQIRKHLADVFETIIRLTSGAARDLVIQLYRLYEVDNLKALIRGVEHKASWDQVNVLLFPLNSFTALPARKMVEAESMAAAIDLVRDTPYYDALSHAMRRYTEEQSTFPLEVALDLAYWRELCHDVEQLPSSDRKPAWRLIGSVLDANNLMWAIRYRINHRLSEEEIINYTLPFNYRVRDEDIRAIAAGADIVSIVNRAYPDLGDVTSLLQEPQTGIPELEMRLQRYKAEVYRSAFIGYPFHIGIPVAYLFLTEMEIQDLTVLMEAKSSQLAPERFEPYLVLGRAST